MQTEKSIVILPKTSKNSGFTLIELILYMLIAAIVVGFSFSMIGSVSQGYTQERRKSKMQTEGRNAVTMMAREIINTGFKIYLKGNGASPEIFSRTIIPNVTTGADGETGVNGASSFYYTPGNPCDELETFKATLNNTGDLVNVDRVKYKVEGTDLFRIRRVRNGGGWDAAEKTLLAENIEALQFRFSENKKDWDNIITDKSLIKAIQIILLVKTSKTVEIKTDKTYDLGNFDLSKNDKYLRRVYKETVEVVNNGI